MAHILVPSLPPGARKSDYAPVKQRPRVGPAAVSHANGIFRVRKERRREDEENIFLFVVFCFFLYIGDFLTGV